MPDNRETRRPSSRNRINQAHPRPFDLHSDASTRTSLFHVPVEDPNYPTRVFEIEAGKNDNVDTISLPGMIEGNYIGAFANAFPTMMNPDGSFRAPRPDEFYSEYRSHAQAYENAVAARPESVAFVSTKQELKDALESGKIAWVRSVEGLYVSPTEEGLQMVSRLMHEGVTNFGIMWNFENGLGRPHIAEQVKDDTGLSGFGRDVVKLIAGMPGALIDISHSSTQTAYDILDNARPGQVIASHAGLRGVNGNESTRNLEPDIAKAVGKTGLIGVPFVGTFMNAGDVNGVIRHMLEFKRILGGTDHLGLGTDFGGTSTKSAVPGLSDVATFGKVLYDAMNETGEFTSGEIEGIFGQNVVRHLENSLK